MGWTLTHSPAVDGTAVRQRFDLVGKRVVGFIGTFGPWHGAEVLASAYGVLLAKRPDLRDSTRLFMIGDGIRLAETRRRLEDEGVLANAVFRRKHSTG